MKTKDEMELILDEVLREKLRDLEDGGGLVTNWILMAEVVDSQGVERVMQVIASPMMTEWLYKGMLGYVGEQGYSAEAPEEDD